MSPRELISSVGQFSKSSVAQKEENPIMAPIRIEINKAPISTFAEDLVRDQSKTRLPNVMPITTQKVTIRNNVLEKTVVLSHHFYDLRTWSHDWTNQHTSNDDHSRICNQTDAC